MLRNNSTPRPTMHLVRATLYRYRLPLVRPLNLGPTTIAARDGMLLRVTTVHNETRAPGWGDIAPLPGFCSYTLDEAQAALHAWATAAVGQPLLPEGTSEAAFAAGSTLPPDRMPPLGAVRFGIESALLDALAEATATPLTDHLGAAARPTIALNALVDASGATTGPALREEARRIRDAGFRAVKVKVGRTSVAEDVARVRDVAGVLGADVGLRLDANRAWSMADALRFADGIADVPLEYLEEPLSDPSRLADWHAATECPVALDETAREKAPDALFAAYPFVRAVVLKPAWTGVRATQAWATAAAAHEAAVVLSSAYESGVGLRMVVALASVLAPCQVPAGLDTYRRLQNDVLETRLPVEGPTVDARSIGARAPSVDRSRLHLIEDITPDDARS